MPPSVTLPSSTSAFHLVRRNPDINMAIGHHTVEVHVELREGDSILDRGVMEKYGISTEELVSRFDSDVEKWLLWIGRDMLAKYKQRVGLQSDLLKVHGTDILLQDHRPDLTPV